MNIYKPIKNSKLLNKYKLYGDLFFELFLGPITIIIAAAAIKYLGGI